MVPSCYTSSHLVAIFPTVRKTFFSMSTLDNLHRFSPWIAERYGLVESVIYAYMEVSIWRLKGRASPKMDKLREIYPYLGSDQIRRALENLSTENEEELYEEGKGWPALLKRRMVGNQYVYRLGFQPSTKVPHGFDPAMAIKYGVAAAVLYDDFARWIIANDVDERHVNGDTPYHYETARQWASVHPYIPLRTVERCLRTLQDADEIVHVFDPFTGILLYCIKDGVRSPVWTIPFGVGKVDRWNQLHRAKEIAPKTNTPTNKNRAPILDDPDEKCLS